MKKSAWISIVFVFILIGSIVVLKTYQYYNTRIYPNTTINGISVGGMTIEEAIAKLEKEKPDIPDGEIVVVVDDISVSSQSADLDLKYRYDETVENAFSIGKSGSPIQKLTNLMLSMTSRRNLTTNPSYDDAKLEEMLTNLQLAVDIIGEPPSASLARSGVASTLEIYAGSPGRILEVAPTIKKIQGNIQHNQLVTEAQVASTSAVLDEEQITIARNNLTNLVGKSIEFKADVEKYTINDQDLISFILPPFKIDEQAIRFYLENWEPQVNREPQNAVFDYDKKLLEVKEFVPDKKGLKLDLDKTIAEIGKNIDIFMESSTSTNTSQTDGAPTNASPANNAISLDLPVVETSATVTLADTNDLGIIERIGFGESEYAHSIPNRAYNVRLTTERISDTIIPPGAEFSFNKTLGEVSARTGFRSAYVIINGRTELGDGGGVCQVSTTVFRSVLNAGLPVTLRLPHSYRVSYYELDSKPGVDATVYSGDVDFRFKNDTGNYILLHGVADTEKLYMYVELYGTSDGRTTELVDHEVWDAKPAPPPQYFEDAGKPPGFIQQVDWAVGGVKTKFTNIVKDKNGNIIDEKEYFSNYRPWSAKYVVGPGYNQP